MNIAIGINPNCSEAIIRINLENQDKDKIEALIEKLQFEFGNSADKFENAGEGWEDDVKILKEFEWSEAWAEQKTIFGTTILEIKGDAPYNYGDQVMKVIKHYLPKAESEWAE